MLVHHKIKIWDGVGLDGNQQSVLTTHKTCRNEFFQLGLVFDKKKGIKLEFFLYIQSWIENRKPVQTVCFLIRKTDGVYSQI